ncbi:MAG: branched-chain amino acid ABC transporter permease [Chloroflexi bacterium]|nr:branched-chain amino acid ABC transporter permease [Chloroflexota bacterium]
MLPCGTFNETYAQDMAIVRTRLQWGLFIAVMVGVLTLPLYASGYIVSTTIATGVTLIAVLGLAIVTGYCGQFSLGQAGFIGVGAYTSAILMTRYNMPFLLAVPAAGFVSALVGLIFAVPSLRIKGFYLVMVTIGAHFIIIWTIVHLPKLTGGADGMVAPWASIGGFTFDSDIKYYYFVIPVVILMTFLAKNIGRTRAGRAFVAIRDNDLAAEVMGINLFSYKMLAFAMSAFYAGIAGALWGPFLGRISPEHFSNLVSVPLGAVWLLGMVIIGGTGSILGAVLGTLFLRVLQEIVSAMTPIVATQFPALERFAPATFGGILFGLAVIVFLIAEPRGLSHRWEIFKASYRLWPFSR